MPSFSPTRRRFFVQRRFFAVHVLHEAGHAAGEGEAFVFAVALVNQFDVYAVIEEGKFADTFGKGVEAVFDVAEGFAAGEETYGCAFFVGIANNLNGSSASPRTKRTKCSLPSR